MDTATEILIRLVGIVVATLIIIPIGRVLSARRSKARSPSRASIPTEADRQDSYMPLAVAGLAMIGAVLLTCFLLIF